MKPGCRQILSEISAYLDGDLETAACERIEQHCSSCASCAGLVEDLKKNAGLCRQLGVTPLPPVVLARARASVRRLLEDSER